VSGAMSAKSPTGAAGAKPRPHLLRGANEMLVDVCRFEREYFHRQPDIADPNHWSALGRVGIERVEAWL